MSDADVAEILKLPAEERLRLVELIWESLGTTPDAVPLSDAHRVAIDEELAGASLLKIHLLGKYRMPLFEGKLCSARELGRNRCGSRRPLLALTAR